MIRYSKNIVCGDYIQYQLVYSSNEVIDMIKHIASFDDEDNNLSYEETLNDDRKLSFIKYFLFLDIVDIDNDINLNDKVDALLEVIGDINHDEEIIFIYSSPYIRDDFSLKYPRFNNIYVSSKTKGLVSDEDIEKVINKILIKNSYYKEVNVNEVSEYSDVYIKFLFNDLLIQSEYENTNVNTSKLVGKKLNDKIQINITYPIKMDSEYEISKIVDKVPFELNDELVCKLDFEGCTNVSDFKEKVKEYYSLIKGFHETIDNIYNGLYDRNTVYISKFALRHYENADSKFSFLPKEEKYDIINDDYIDVYINNRFCDLDTKSIDSLKTYYKKEYKFNSLIKDNKCKDFYDFFRTKITEGNLYLFIKNNKEDLYD